MSLTTRSGRSGGVGVAVDVGVGVVVSPLHATDNDVATSSIHSTTNAEVLIMPLSLLSFTLQTLCSIIAF